MIESKIRGLELELGRLYYEVPAPLAERIARIPKNLRGEVLFVVYKLLECSADVPEAMFEYEEEKGWLYDDYTLCTMLAFSRDRVPDEGAPWWPVLSDDEAEVAHAEIVNGEAWDLLASPEMAAFLAPRAQIRAVLGLTQMTAAELRRFIYGMTSMAASAVYRELKWG